MSLINVSNLTFSYEGSYDNIFENVSFQIDTDWKLGFIGRNGRGKTTFLNLLLGKYAYSGNISSTVKFEYFPYDVEDKSLYTIEVMKSICTECMDWEIFREISLLDVQEDALYRPFNTLSNGEQTKVLLAALFLTASCFLLIDEPTNHLDIDARNVVQNYLKRKKGFILVSHDRSLLDQCVDHILSINKTNIEIQKGNFTSWWENKTLQDNFELAENKKLLKEIGRLSYAAKRSSNWSNKVEKSKYGTTNSGSKLDKGYVGHKAAKAMKRAKNIESRHQEAVLQKSELLHNIEQYDDLKISPLEFHKECLIEANDLSLSYGDKEVCSNLNFRVNIGDRVAIIGKNGSGKSSILKLINGDDIKFTGNF
ncbi:TPA: ABC-F type ribosomal protection protein Lsa(E), partial [Staphylococcus aureus]